MKVQTIYNFNYSIVKVFKVQSITISSEVYVCVCFNLPIFNSVTTLFTASEDLQSLLSTLNYAKLSVFLLFLALSLLNNGSFLVAESKSLCTSDGLSLSEVII